MAFAKCKVQNCQLPAGSLQIASPSSLLITHRQPITLKSPLPDAKLRQLVVNSQLIIFLHTLAVVVVPIISFRANILSLTEHAQPIRE